MAMEAAMVLAMSATSVRRLLQDHTAAVDMVTARDLQKSVAVVVVVVALFDFPTDVGNEVSCTQVFLLLGTLEQ